MKRRYWHLSKVSWQVYALMILLAVLGLTAVEIFKVEIKQPSYEDKLKAARIMHNGLYLIKAYRMSNLKESVSLDDAADPAGSNLIGVLTSPITSSPGSLQAKRASVNPNWAAVLVDMIKHAKVKKGDTIAMGFSGSFPAINLAALSAAEALELKAIVITSVASSSWGANIPEFTWLDMEDILYRNRITSSKSIAASLGGREDRGKGITKDGRKMLQEAMRRNNIPFLPATKTRGKNIDSRMALYQKYTEAKPIAAYINVGSGTISVGTDIGKRLFKPGLNLKAKPQVFEIDSVMTGFIQQGVPVIHMWPISALAKKYELPLEPKKIPPVGEGKIFKKIGYRNSLVIGVLVFLILVICALIRMDIGYRIFSPRQSLPKSPPEPMV